MHSAKPEILVIVMSETEEELGAVELEFGELGEEDELAEEETLALEAALELEEESFELGAALDEVSLEADEEETIDDSLPFEDEFVSTFFEEEIIPLSELGAD